jgi:hypothetical protein
MGGDGYLIRSSVKSNVQPFRVLVKALCLFVVINILYAIIDPQGARVSGYNLIFPGRTRLPFGVGGDPYSVAIEEVDFTFPSHRISVPKASNEYRVVLIGDSSLWGEDLGAYEVISEQWNMLNIQCGDKIIKTYDLGYPHPSVLKDLVIMHKTVEYEPDLIVWFITLNTLISQRINPFLVANRERAAEVLSTYDIGFQHAANFEATPTFYEKTLIGQRSHLSRWIKLEMLGLVWAATGEDTNRLTPGAPPDFGVSEDPRYRGMEPSQDLKDLLLFKALAAGHKLADPIPVLIVNEPIFIAVAGKSSVRYNAVYPRWAYDQYREHMADQSQSAGWNYLDLWNAVPPEYFADARFHLKVDGEQLLIQQINPVVQSMGCGSKP